MNRSDNNRFYKECFEQLDAPIFYSPWWLDITCQKGRWDVCIVKDKGGKKPLGVLPYFITILLNRKIIRTPPFTPYLGVWLNYSNCSDRLTKRYSFENQVIGALIDQLPKTAWYHQIHPEQLKNWLPFYWKDFRQTTRYTYEINNLYMDFIYTGFHPSVKNKIRKAESAGLSVKPVNDLPKFIGLIKKTFKRQNIKSWGDVNIFQQLHQDIQKNKAGTIYFAEDKNGRSYAGLYLIWDRESAYCWMLGADTEMRKTGAVQLLIWHTIQETVKMGKKYNFEGSMLPHIEPVFRAFGAERKPVHQIYKASNRILYAFRELLPR